MAIDRLFLEQIGFSLRCIGDEMDSAGLVTRRQTLSNYVISLVLTSRRLLKQIVWFDLEPVEAFGKL